MDNLTLFTLTIGVFLAIFLMASLVTIPLRRQRGEEGHAEVRKEEKGSLLTMLFAPVARPAMVLVITFFLLDFLATRPDLIDPARFDPRYIKAWYLFWFILLFFNVNEGVGRLIYALRRRRFPVPDLIFFLVRMVLIGATAFAILHFVLDFDTSHLLTSTAVVAAVIGIGLREVLGNYLAGLSLNLVGTVEPSQWIAVGDKEGEIIQRNWRETRLRTTGGHILILPNSVVAASSLNNMTWGSPLRRHQLLFSLTFFETPQRVTRALIQAALSVPEVDRGYKQPDAYILQYREFGIVYQLRFWSRTYFDRSKIEGQVYERAWYHLQRAGMENPFPEGWTLPLYYQAVPEHSPQTPQGVGFKHFQEVAGKVRSLRECGFVQRLLQDGVVLVAEDSLALFAAMLDRRLFAHEEALIRQGMVLSSCFILVRGEIKGFSEYTGLGRSGEFRVELGSLLGEMSLLTGLPSTATLIAEGEVEVLEVSREAFAAFLEANPVVSDAISRLVGERSRNMVADLQRLESIDPRRVDQALGEGGMLARLLGRGRGRRGEE